jgi:signal peptidase I
VVNKFAYWFDRPHRGDIVVFKVPDRIWQADKPIYVKRCVGEPADHLSFDREGHLLVNRVRLTHPGFFLTQCYVDWISSLADNLFKGREIDRVERTIGKLTIEGIDVPNDEIYVFGDNAYGSLDSRYWGGVPLDRLKGRAFLRYWPWNQMKFLRDE